MAPRPCPGHFAGPSGSAQSVRAFAEHCFVLLRFAAAQVALAALSAHLPIWAVIALAWVFGSMLNVCLFQLAHECNHNLIFKKTFWNRVCFTFTSLPMFLSGHHTWWAEHLTHHSDMGAKKDFITRRRTFFLTSRILSPMFFPVFAADDRHANFPQRDRSGHSTSPPT